MNIPTYVWLASTSIRRAADLYRLLLQHSRLKWMGSLNNTDGNRYWEVGDGGTYRSPSILTVHELLVSATLPKIVAKYANAQ